MPVRKTAKTLRGIPHLMKYLGEDVEYDPLDLKHPMYRRLKGPEKQELNQLLTWLEEQGPPKPTASEDVAES